jgi:nucleoside diphosphate kinase
MKSIIEFLTESKIDITDCLFSVIKPEFLDYKKEIKKMIVENGYFSIVRSKKVTLTKEQASELYIDKKNEDYYDDLVKYMSSGPCVIMIVKDEKTGPEPVKALIRIKEECRKKFGKSDMKNCLHSSDSFKNAAREIHICFGE